MSFLILKRIVLHDSVTNIFHQTTISECVGLDLSWGHATTETHFPVNEYDTIIVQCKEGYINKGEVNMTCVNGTTFFATSGNGKKPHCTRASKSGCMVYSKTVETVV